MVTMRAEVNHEGSPATVYRRQNINTVLGLISRHVEYYG
jgi:hypothetical protein